MRSLLLQSVTANLDVNRYYGLPKIHPHNHGVMANIALIGSADVLNQPTLIDAA